MENSICIRQQADQNQIDRCKTTVSGMKDAFEYLSSGLELIGNNVRMKILFLIYREQKLCVCDLSDILGMTISAVSQHLRKLKDRKLIKSERQAQTIFYSLTEEHQKLCTSIFKLLDEPAVKKVI